MPPRRKTFPSPKRFNAPLSAAADTRLRALNADWGFSDNSLLTVLLEHRDEIADPAALDTALPGFVETYGAPAPPRPSE